MRPAHHGNAPETVASDTGDSDTSSVSSNGEHAVPVPGRLRLTLSFAADCDAIPASSPLRMLPLATQQICCTVLKSADQAKQLADAAQRNAVGIVLFSALSEGAGETTVTYLRVERFRETVHPRPAVSVSVVWWEHPAACPPLAVPDKHAGSMHTLSIQSHSQEVTTVVDNQPMTRAGVEDLCSRWPVLRVLWTLLQPSAVPMEETVLRRWLGAAAVMSPTGARPGCTGRGTKRSAGAALLTAEQARRQEGRVGDDEDASRDHAQESDAEVTSDEQACNPAGEMDRPAVADAGTEYAGYATDDGAHASVRDDSEDVEDDEPADDDAEATEDTDASEDECDADGDRASSGASDSEVEEESVSDVEEEPESTLEPSSEPAAKCEDVADIDSGDDSSRLSQSHQSGDTERSNSVSTNDMEGVSERTFDCSSTSAESSSAASGEDPPS